VGCDASLELHDNARDGHVLALFLENAQVGLEGGTAASWAFNIHREGQLVVNGHLIK
jgi:hypothetical protein